MVKLMVDKKANLALDSTQFYMASYTNMTKFI